MSEKPDDKPDVEALAMVFRFLMAGGGEVLKWDAAIGNDEQKTLRLVYEDAKRNPERLQSVLNLLPAVNPYIQQPSPSVDLVNRETYAHRAGAANNEQIQKRQSPSGKQPETTQRLFED